MGIAESLIFLILMSLRARCFTAFFVSVRPSRISGSHHVRRYEDLLSTRKASSKIGCRQNSENKPNQHNAQPIPDQDLARALARRESEYDASGQGRPELVHYLEVLKAWSNSSLADGPQRAARLLERMEKFAETPGYQHIQPSVECYEVVVQACTERYPSVSERWLRRMEELWRQHLHTDDLSTSETLKRAYNMCLDAWRRWSNPSPKGQTCSGRAAALLQRMQQLSYADPAFGPDNFSYTTVLRACVQTGNANAAKKLLAELERLYQDDPLISTVQPNSMMYSLVIHALAHSRGGERAALEAEKLLEGMARSRIAKPNAYTYEGVISSWGKSRTGTRGAKRAEAILEHMNKLYDAGNHDAKPLTINVNAVVKAWSVCRGGVEAAEKCESILRRMDPECFFHRTHNDVMSVWPNIETVNAAISAWGNCGSPEGPARAENILNYLDTWNQYVPQNRRIQATVDTYNMIIASYARSKGGDSPRKAEALLYRLINLGAPDVSDGKGLTKAFGQVISCWCKSSDPLGPERAEQLLRVLEKKHAEGLTNAKPNVIIYSQVLDGWSKSGTSYAYAKARAIFDQMMASEDPDVRPNTITFNSMISALANRKNPDAAKEAKKILDSMHKLEAETGWDVAINSRTITSYMTCLAKSSKYDASFAREAENLIDDMLRRAESMAPDSFVFTTAVNAWAWSGSDAAPEGILRVINKMETLFHEGVISSEPHAICYNAAVRFFLDRSDLNNADMLVERMEAAFLNGVKVAAPDRVTYSAVLNAYAQSEDDTSIDGALKLFQRQRGQALKGNLAAIPNNVCYNMIMACLGKSRNPAVRLQALDLLDEMKNLSKSGDAHVKPDTVSYTTAINIISKSSDTDAAANAINLLTEMERQFTSGDPDVKPNLLSFNSVLKALSKSRKKAAALKAEKLLTKMVKLSKSDVYSDVKPDLISYTAVIDAWSGVKVKGAAERAEAILRLMERRGVKEPSFPSPDVVTYNKVILSWARDGNPQRAEAILREMEVSESVDPDGFSYKTTLLAWSQVEGGAEKAEELLDCMEQNFLLGNVDMKPDILCYKAVAAAWKDAGATSEKQIEVAMRLDSITQERH